MKSVAQETFLCGRFFLKAFCYFPAIAVYLHHSCGEVTARQKKETLCAAPSNYLIEKMQKDRQINNV